MFSPPTTASPLTGISEGQSIMPPVSMPIATTSSNCDMASLDLPTTLAATTNDLDTSHDSAASDSSFPVVSLPSTNHHQTSSSLSGSELDSSPQGTSDASRDVDVRPPGEDVPLIIGTESHASEEGATKAQVNGNSGTNFGEKDHVYTKRSVDKDVCLSVRSVTSYIALSKPQIKYTCTYASPGDHLLYMLL